MSDQEEQSRIIYLQTESLRPHSRNERIYGTEPVDEALCESIREIGIDTPLEVTPDGSIIKGHRRWACAKHLGLETVPCRVRDDLKDEHSIIYSLIEDNRHQRSRTPLQRQRETEEIIEIVKARRALLGDPDVNHAARLGQIDLSKAETMSPEVAEKLDEDIASAQEKITSPVARGKSYHIGLKISGQPKAQYDMAKIVNTAVDRLKQDGKDKEALDLSALAARNLKAARREADVILELKPSVRTNRTKVRPATLDSQFKNCFTAIETLKTLLPNQDDQRANLALTTLKKLQESLKSSENTDAGH